MVSGLSHRLPSASCTLSERATQLTASVSTQRPEAQAQRQAARKLVRVPAFISLHSCSVDGYCWT